MDNGMVYLSFQGLDTMFPSQYLDPYEEPAGLPWPHPLETASKGVASLRAYLQQHPDQVRRNLPEYHLQNGCLQFPNPSLDGHF